MSGKGEIFVEVTGKIVKDIPKAVAEAGDTLMGKAVAETGQTAVGTVLVGEAAEQSTKEAAARLAGEASTPDLKRPAIGNMTDRPVAQRQPFQQQRANAGGAGNPDPVILGPDGKPARTAFEAAEARAAEKAVAAAQAPAPVAARPVAQAPAPVDPTAGMNPLEKATYEADLLAQQARAAEAEAKIAALRAAATPPAPTAAAPTATTAAPAAVGRKVFDSAIHGTDALPSHLRNTPDNQVDSAIKRASDRFDQLRANKGLNRPDVPTTQESDATILENISSWQRFKWGAFPSRRQNVYVTNVKDRMSAEVDRNAGLILDSERLYRTQRADAAADVAYLVARKHNYEVASGAIEGELIDLTSPRDVNGFLANIPAYKDFAARTDPNLRYYNGNIMANNVDEKVFNVVKHNETEGIAFKQEVSSIRDERIVRTFSDYTVSGVLGAHGAIGLFVANPPVALTASALNLFNGSGFLSRGAKLLTAVGLWTGAAAVKEGADSYDKAKDGVLSSEDLGNGYWQDGKKLLSGTIDNAIPFVGESKFEPFVNSSSVPMVINTVKTGLLIADGVYISAEPAPAPAPVGQEGTAASSTDWNALLNGNGGQTKPPATEGGVSPTDWNKLVNPAPDDKSPVR